MLRKLVRQLGFVKASALTTVVAVLISLFVSSIFELLGRGTVSPENLFFATAMPLMLAPLFNYFFLRLVIQLEELQEQLREIAIKDGLTQVFNRRHWIELAELELARARRYGGVFSIIIFDVDNFKCVNDTHGHLAGDLVLRQLSETCVAQSRKFDTFARYGGEEFVFLLPQSGNADTWLFAERIRNTLAAKSFCYCQTEIRITVSIGVITFDPSMTGLDDLLSKADRALYMAKRTGKNKTVVAEELALACPVGAQTNV